MVRVRLMVMVKMLLFAIAPLNLRCVPLIRLEPVSFVIKQVD